MLDVVDAMKSSVINYIIALVEAVFVAPRYEEHTNFHKIESNRFKGVPAV